MPSNLIEISTKSTTITFRVGKCHKNEWQKFADQHFEGNLTRFITTATIQYIIKKTLLPRGLDFQKLMESELKSKDPDDLMYLWKKEHQGAYIDKCFYEYEIRLKELNDLLQVELNKIVNFKLS